LQIYTIKVVQKVGTASRPAATPQILRKMLSFSKLAILLLGLLALCFLTTFAAKVVVESLSSSEIVNEEEVCNCAKGAASTTTATVPSMPVMSSTVLSWKSFQIESIMILNRQNPLANYYLPYFAAKAVVGGGSGMTGLINRLDEKRIEDQDIKVADVTELLEMDNHRDSSGRLLAGQNFMVRLFLITFLLNWWETRCVNHFR